MKDTKQWHISAWQMNVQYGKPSENEQRIKQAIEERMKNHLLTKPDLLVFPEMWNTGYDLTRLQDIADPGGRRTHHMMVELAKRYQVNILAGSIAALRDDGIYNASYGFDRQGESFIAYDKIHLFHLMNEQDYLEPGMQGGFFELEGVKGAVMICYDLRFPELARKLAVQGAGVMIVPAQWPQARRDHWLTLLKARAIENQMYVIGCNRTGSDHDTAFEGGSIVFDPWGREVSSLSNEEAWMEATCDWAQVEKARTTINILGDRRPEHYELPNQ